MPRGNCPVEDVQWECLEDPDSFVLENDNKLVGWAVFVFLDPAD